MPFATLLAMTQAAEKLPIAMAVYSLELPSDLPKMIWRSKGVKVEAVQLILVSSSLNKAVDWAFLPPTPKLLASWAI